MESSVIDTVAKYFYFCCLDERLSFAASLKVLADLRAHEKMDAEHRTDWIRALTKWRRKLKYLHPKAFSTRPNAKGYDLPAEFDVGAWITFLSSCEPTEVEAVLLSRILGFKDQEIAAGLDVTEGTVRYRVGRGLRHLGGFVEF